MTETDQTLVQRSVTTSQRVPPAPAEEEGQTIVTQREVVTVQPGITDIARRVVVLVFGVLQGLLILRVVLLGLAANTGNPVVDGILRVTSPFVRPFDSMFRIDRISLGGGSVLDVAALVALIGWTLLQLLILAILSLNARRAAAV